MNFLTKAGRPSCARHLDRRPKNGRCELPGHSDFTADLLASYRTGTCAARNGSSASMIMKFREAR